MPKMTEKIKSADHLRGNVFHVNHRRILADPPDMRSLFVA